MDYGTRHSYLFRVLRPDEDPSRGIHPKTAYSTSSVKDHVAYGSRSHSQYISTSADKYTAQRFAKLGMEKRQVQSKRLVTISVDKLANVPGIKIIDLTDHRVRHLHGVNDNERASIFSYQWKEVLIDGHIPATCITALEEITLMYGEINVKTLRFETQAQIREREIREERERANYCDNNQVLLRAAREREERQERERQERERQQWAREAERIQNERRERLYAEQRRREEEQRKKQESWCIIM